MLISLLIKMIFISGIYICWNIICTMRLYIYTMMNHDHNINYFLSLKIYDDDRELEEMRFCGCGSDMVYYIYSVLINFSNNVTWLHLLKWFLKMANVLGFFLISSYAFCSASLVDHKLELNLREIPSSSDVNLNEEYFQQKLDHDSDNTDTWSQVLYVF